MKRWMILLSTVVLLFSCATLASAEMLFGVSAETGKVDVNANYSNNSLTDYSESSNLTMVNAELNLVLTRVYLECSKTEMDHASLTSYGVKTGWELGPKILRAQILGGLQGYSFDDNQPKLASLESVGGSSFVGLVGGIGAESKWGNVTFYGSTVMSLVTRSTSDTQGDDNGSSIQNSCVGIAFAPLPMVDLFVNYRIIDVKSDFLKIDYKGVTAGAKISF